MKKLIYLGLLMGSLTFAEGYVDLNLAYGNPYFKLKGGYGGVKALYEDNVIKVAGFYENKIDNINLYAGMGGRLGESAFKGLISKKPLLAFNNTGTNTTPIDEDSARYIKSLINDKASNFILNMYKYNIKIYVNGNKDTNLLNYQIKSLIPLYAEMGISYFKNHLYFSYDTEFDYEKLVFNITEGNHSENGIDPENDMFDSSFTGTNYISNNKFKFEYKNLKHFNIGSEMGVKYVQSNRVMEVKTLTNSSSFKNLKPTPLFKSTGKNIYVAKEIFLTPSVFVSYNYKIKGFTIMPGAEIGMIYHNYKTKNTNGEISDIFVPDKDTNVNDFSGFITPSLYLEYKLTAHSKVYSDNSVDIRRNRINVKAGLGFRHEW